MPYVSSMSIHVMFSMCSMCFCVPASLFLMLFLCGERDLVPDRESDPPGLLQLLLELSHVVLSHGLEFRVQRLQGVAGRRVLTKRLKDSKRQSKRHSKRLEASENLKLNETRNNSYEISPEIRHTVQQCKVPGCPRYGIPKGSDSQ